MRIALIGLGNMGLPMAANLLKAGHAVIGHDVVRAALDAHAANGGSVADSIAEAVAGAEVVITMLPAGQHVAEVYLGGKGVLASIGTARPLLIDSSTIDVATARRVASEVAKRGMEMLDAPVSGGVGGATAGTLTFMCGGTEAAFARAKPVLQCMGKNIFHAGESGAGQTVKICNNMMLAVSMFGVAEAFVLADRLGLDRQKLYDIVSTATGRSWALTDYCPAPGPVPSAPSNRDYAGGFMASLMLKDLTLAKDAAESVDAPTPLGAHAQRLYQAVNEAGEGARDFSVVFRWLSGRSRGEVT
jgi:3-hydroxyisobutyrate dehydrogenase